MTPATSAVTTSIIVATLRFLPDFTFVEPSTTRLALGRLAVGRWPACRAAGRAGADVRCRLYAVEVSEDFGAIDSCVRIIWMELEPPNPGFVVGPPGPA